MSLGFPSPVNDLIEGEIELQRLLIVNRPATFLVRVTGDSMILARLFDGYLAVVDRSLTPRTGEVFVVNIDGERSFKVWKRQGPRISLHLGRAASLIRNAKGRLRIAYHLAKDARFRAAIEAMMADIERVVRRADAMRLRVNAKAMSAITDSPGEP